MRFYWTGLSTGNDAGNCRLQCVHSACALRGLRYQQAHLLKQHEELIFKEKHSLHTSRSTFTPAAGARPATSAACPGCGGTHDE